MQKLFSQESIAVLIAGTRRSIKQYAWEKLRPWRVTPQQCGVLLVLFSDGGMSLGEVAGRIWCDNPTACRIVNKLVERGFVRSDSDSQDRRRFRLYLTAEGQALCGELTQCANAVAKTLEQGLSQDDLINLRRILGHVMTNAVNAAQRPVKASDAGAEADAGCKSKTPDGSSDATSACCGEALDAATGSACDGMAEDASGVEAPGRAIPADPSRHGTSIGHPPMAGPVASASQEMQVSPSEASAAPNKPMI